MTEGHRHLRAVERPAPDSGQVRALARAKRASRFVGLFLPLVLVAVGTAITLWWVPRMPDPMATHWSGGDGPDGFGPPWTNAAIAGGVGLGIIVLLQGASFVQTMKAGAPAWSWTHRFMSAMTLATVLLIEFTAVGSAAVQLDLSDATAAPGVDGLMLLAGGVAVVAGVVGFLVQPRVSIHAPAGETGEPLRLGADERAVWVGEVRPSTGFIWIMVATILLVTASTVFTYWAGSALWIMNAVLAVLVVVLGVTMCWFRVRIDADGVVARSLLGWPVFRVEAADIADIVVKEIHPFSEFGGWGTRWIPGTGFGIVMRTGEGLVVTRRDGRIFALTIDDAEGAAALLAAVGGADGDDV